ncbi:MAG: hypothetical protein WCN98_15160, partial [Verrucomicrobiaceae bacterium]
MKTLILRCLFTISLPAVALCGADFSETIKTTLAETAAARPLAVQGQDKRWFFLRKELEHLAKG